MDMRKRNNHSSKTLGQNAAFSLKTGPSFMALAGNVRLVLEPLTLLLLMQVEES